MKTLYFACGLIVGIAVASLIGYGEVRRAWDAEEKVHADYDAARRQADANVKSLELQLFGVRAVLAEHVRAEAGAPPPAGCGELALERVAEAAVIGNSQERVNALTGIVAPCLNEQLKNR